jgi:hypothetical protein
MLSSHERDQLFQQYPLLATIGNTPLVRVEGRTLAVYRDDIKGRVVTVNLGLPSGLSLLELRATIQQHARGRGKKRHVYFRTPPVCPPSGEWTTTVIFTYLDGSSQQLADGSPCTHR